MSGRKYTSHTCSNQESHVFEDGFKNINRLGPRLQQRLYVCFIDKLATKKVVLMLEVYSRNFGQVSVVAFNVNYGLWALTDGNLMYPSPQRRSCTATV